MISLIAACFRFIIRIGLWLYATPLLIICSAGVASALVLESSWFTDGTACGMWRPLPLLLPVTLATAPLFVWGAPRNRYSPVKLLLIIPAVSAVLLFGMQNPPLDRVSFSYSDVHWTCAYWGMLWVMWSWGLALAGFHSLRQGRRLRNWHRQTRQANET